MEPADVQKCATVTKVSPKTEPCGTPLTPFTAALLLRFTGLSVEKKLQTDRWIDMRTAKTIRK